jgi:hypothetical protein
MNINIKTKYEIGQFVSENGLEGTVVRIEIIVHSEDYQDVDYILDNGGKIKIGFKSPTV